MIPLLMGLNLLNHLALLTEYYDVINNSYVTWLVTANYNGGFGGDTERVWTDARWRFLILFRSCLLSTWHRATVVYRLQMAQKHTRICRGTDMQQGTGTSWQPHMVWFGCNIRKEWRLHIDTSSFCSDDYSQLGFEPSVGRFELYFWTEMKLIFNTKIIPRPA